MNKKVVLGPFYRLMNKAKIYEVVEMKGKLVTDGGTIGYWVLADMSRYK